MSAVTLSRKRYMDTTHRSHAGRTVYCCIVCDCLTCAERSHALTCSPACRVRLHRGDANAQSKLRIAGELNVTPRLMLAAGALYKLRPDLAASVQAGTLTLAQAQPAMWAALWALIHAEVQA